MKKTIPILIASALATLATFSGSLVTAGPASADSDDPPRDADRICSVTKNDTTAYIVVGYSVEEGCGKFIANPSNFTAVSMFGAGLCSDSTANQTICDNYGLRISTVDVAEGSTTNANTCIKWQYTSSNHLDPKAELLLEPQAGCEPDYVTN